MLIAMIDDIRRPLVDCQLLQRCMDGFLWLVDIARLCAGYDSLQGVCLLIIASLPTCTASIPLFLTFVGIPYAKLCLTLAYFHLWPFGKFIVRDGVRTLCMWWFAFSSNR